MHTSSYPMHLVLDEEINQWYQGAKEGAGKYLPISHGLCIPRAQSQDAQCPWKRRNQI
jgi:hypothetical protein